MTEKWIVNASPVIILAKLDLISLFDQLSAEWIIPSGVAEEIKDGEESDPARIWLEQHGMPKVREVPHVHPNIASWDLGKGESEVLSWAYEHPDYMAILDDLAARNCVQGLNIEVHGTLWILIKAKREQKIVSLTPILPRLTEIGFRLSPQLLAMVKQLAGED